MTGTYVARVQPVKGADLIDIDKRHSSRHPCRIEATSRPIDACDGIAGDIVSWGGTVTDLSAGGLKLGLCFPFRVGCYLTVALHAGGAPGYALLCRVVHVHDHVDGTWTLGCEFVQPLSGSDLDLLL